LTKTIIGLVTDVSESLPAEEQWCAQQCWWQQDPAIYGTWHKIWNREWHMAQSGILCASWIQVTNALSSVSFTISESSWPLVSRCNELTAVSDNCWSLVVHSFLTRLTAHK
jgi:hypothetical protein